MKKRSYPPPPCVTPTRPIPPPPENRGHDYRIRELRIQAAIAIHAAAVTCPGIDLTEPEASVRSCNHAEFIIDVADKRWGPL